jgi:WS/DGAT/MGAT family acyltransferase
MPRAEKMQAVDTTWLRMDHPTNRMVILGVLLLQGPVDLTRLERHLADRLLRHQRFRQRVEHSGGSTWWCDDPHFDIGRHIKRAHLPAPGGKQELQNFAAELASRPLDTAHPLWQFHLIEDYEGGVAVVTRIHHAIADGMALIGVMLSLTDDGPTPEPPKPHHEDDAFRTAVEPVLDAIGQGLKWSNTLLDAAKSPTKLADLLRQGSDVAAELSWLLTMPSDSATRFKGPLCGDKRVAWSEPLSLRDVKAVGHALGCSVNDVLLASVAGALRSYLVSRGDPTEGVQIRALVPVNLRPEAVLAGQLGNHFGVLGVLLPVGEANPLARVFEVRKRMKELKSSKEAVVTLGLMAGLGHAPRLVQDQLFDLILSRATAVMTNVPGPQWELRLAGAPVRQVIFWVPQSGGIGMGVSILTYNGQVQFGLMSDTALLADPDQVICRFATEFENLLLHVLMTA